MNTIRTWLHAHLDALVWPLLALCIAGSIGIANVLRPARVEAAAVAKATPEPGVCSIFASDGPIVVMKCVDSQTGGVLFFNNVGMMAVGQP